MAVVDSVLAWAPYSLFHAEDIVWGADIAGMTPVLVTGTHEIAETPGRLGVTFRNIAAGDANALLKARAFAIGDEWVTNVRLLATAATNYRGGGLVFTDGAVAGSNAAAVILYFGDGSWKISVWHGTLTALAVTPWLFDGQQAYPFTDGFYVKLRYQAVNSFTAFFSHDGLRWTNWASVPFAKAMVPTHVGPCWTNFGGVGMAADSFITFGPLCKVA